MLPLMPNDLLSLEEYDKIRPEFRQKVMAHKKNLRVHLGEHMTFLFEDRLTIQYQVQEMLRAEKIFQQAAILEELAVYNPLIPDENNLKATLLIEYPAEIRAQNLIQLHRIEYHINLLIGQNKTCAIANEDLERSDDQKTSAVHFLRFQLNAEMLNQLDQPIMLEVNHPHYQAQCTLFPEQKIQICGHLLDAN